MEGNCVVSPIPPPVLLVTLAVNCSWPEPWTRGPKASRILTLSRMTRMRSPLPWSSQHSSAASCVRAIARARMYST